MLSLKPAWSSDGEEGVELDVGRQPRCLSGMPRGPEPFPSEVYIQHYLAFLPS